ncbi:galactosyldiacylglycerol synthase [Dactylosporangium maewongense]|uniref:Galactosyldiacylglycerol synthase n=1 Tax=Dactylosporangium maewongense TaxID=634393 RepID=A0ABN2D4L1_9ACTN
MTAPRMHGRSARVVVISASFGAGHDGAAAELSRRLRLDGFAVQRHDFVDLLPRRAGRLLRGMYRRQLTTLPATWGWLLSAVGTAGVAAAASRLTALADEATLAAVGPDAAAVVSTYPLAGQVLGRLRRDGRLKAPALTYLTDLSVHPLWIAGGVDTHLALHDEAARQARRHGARDVRVVAPAVSPAFGRTPPVTSQVRQRLRFGLPAVAPLALIVAGAWGVGAVERAAADIAATGLAVPVVACGRNDPLRHRLARTGRVVALGWIDDMAALMRTCQVVVQNAGGLSSLEALTAGVPVVTYRSVPGHGRSNAEALDVAGWVPWIRDPADLAAALRQAMVTPNAFRPAAIRPETVIAAAAGMPSPSPSPVPSAVRPPSPVADGGPRVVAA